MRALAIARARGGSTRGLDADPTTAEALQTINQIHALIGSRIGRGPRACLQSNNTNTTEFEELQQKAYTMPRVNRLQEVIDRWSRTQAAACTLHTMTKAKDDQLGPNANDAEEEETDDAEEEDSDEEEEDEESEADSEPDETATKT